MWYITNSDGWALHTPVARPTETHRPRCDSIFYSLTSMAIDIEKDRVTQAYERLRHLIVHGRLAPGSRVIETDLADRLGVSRTPVRSALQRLEQEGFIQSPNMGQRWKPTVAPLTKEDGNELFHLIGQLEGLAAWYSTQLDDEDHRELVETLGRLNERLAEIAEDSSHQASDYYDIDSAFHRAYVASGGGPRLKALLEAIKPQAERYARVYVSLLTDGVDTSVREHGAIAQAIKERDAEAAQRAVEANWRGAAQRLAGVIDQLGERGSW